MNSKLTFLGIVIFIFAFKNSADKTILNYPKNWPKPLYDFRGNPLDSNKILLGKVLFYDPILSRDNTISCASCHLQQTAFTHIDHELSHGIEGRIGKRNSIALQNLAWAKNFMWDGAIHHLDAQALAPIHDKNEMDFSIAELVIKLKNDPYYKNGFRKAFGDSLITGERILKSIAQFELSLISANSKYDQVMRKESGHTFTELEDKGYQLFLKHCNVCHKEPMFTNYEFENNGLDLDTTLRDFGRMSITHKKSDSLKFKVPSLRNILRSPPYMHDGRYPNIEMVLFHYSDNLKENKFRSEKLNRNLSLSPEEKKALISFLSCLTDQEFLRNKRHRFVSKYSLK